MKRVLLFFVMASFLPSSTVAQVNLEWVNRFELSNQEQTALSFTLDDSNNVLIVGRDYSFTDNAYLVKINSNGFEEWNKILIDTVGAHIVTKIICDQFGNSYLSLYPEDSYFGDEPYVTKISSYGNSIWIDSTDIFGESLSLDTSGNLICLFSDFGIHMKKYNGNGNTIWEIVNDTFSNAANVISMYLIQDEEANLYVGGKNNNNFTEYGFNLKKFTPEGNFIWSIDYNPTIEDDNLYFVVVDSNSNAFLGGTVFHGDSGIAIVKVDSLGEIVWDTSIFPINSFDAILHDMIVDPQGNILSVGSYRILNEPDCYYLISKINSQGELLWSHKIDSAYIGRRIGDLAVDAFENVYLTWCSLNSQDEALDINIAKYDPNGTIQWNKSYNDLPGAHAIPLGIELDKENNIYIVGKGKDSSLVNYDIITLKYSQVVGFPSVYSSINLIRVFPNPFHTSSIIQIPQRLQSLNILELKVFDLPGREVRNEKISSAEASYQFHRKNLPAGMYLIKLIAEGKAVASAKIIIE